MDVVLKRVRVLVFTAAIALSLLGGATQAAAGSGKAVWNLAPAQDVYTILGVSWE